MAIRVGPGGAGGFAPDRFQQNFYGENLNPSATRIGNIMGANLEVGIPFPSSVITRNVAVRFRRDAGPAPGDWELRLFKNGAMVATFAVVTT